MNVDRSQIMKGGAHALFLDAMDLLSHTAKLVDGLNLCARADAAMEKANQAGLITRLCVQGEQKNMQAVQIKNWRKVHYTRSEMPRFGYVHVYPDRWIVTLCGQIANGRFTHEVECNHEEVCKTCERSKNANAKRL